MVSDSLIILFFSRKARRSEINFLARLLLIPIIVSICATLIPVVNTVKLIGRQIESLLERAITLEGTSNPLITRLAGRAFIFPR